jgi:hypothetical protein
MAAGITYTPIATTTLGSAQSSVTFSSISGSYTDLILIINGTSSGDAGCRVQFNGDTGTNYSNTLFYGIYTTAGIQNVRNTNATTIDGLGRLNTTEGIAIIQIQNYSNTTTYKTVLGKGGTTTNGIFMTTVGLWRSTSAITSIVASLENSRTFSSGTTLAIYGIAAA